VEKGGLNFSMAVASKVEGVMNEAHNEEDDRYNVRVCARDTATCLWL
jgi:hypothetical protein